MRTKAFMAAILGMMLASLAIAKDPAASEPADAAGAATQTSATAASVTVDTSTPKLAAVSLARAIDAGDATAGKACVMDDPRQQELVGAMTTFTSSLNNLKTAIKNKWGANGQPVIDNLPDLGSLEDQVKAGKEEITGDTATVTQKDADGGDSDPLHLARVNGKWKVDLSKAADFEANYKQCQEMLATAMSFDDLARGIDDGRTTLDKLKNKFRRQ